MKASRDEVVLYGHWICPYSVRIEFDLVRLGRPYRVIDVPPTGVRPPGFVLPEEFMTHSPRREIPMIRDAEGFLADSLPILDRLNPDATDQARQMARLVDAVAFPPMIGVYYASSDAEAEAASGRLAGAMEQIASLIDEGGWLTPQGPSMAEAALVPLYIRLEGLRHLGFRATLPPAVRRHAEACLDLEAGRAVSWSPAQTSEFVDRLSRRRHG